MFFQGITKTSDGKLCVIGLAATDVIPAGATVVDGMAVSSSGYLYVVFA